VIGEGFGVCYTRTGRRFFDDAKLENEMLTAVRSALDAVGFWDDFKTSWVCLDAELMPWSAKSPGSFTRPIRGGRIGSTCALE